MASATFIFLLILVLYSFTKKGSFTKNIYHDESKHLILSQQGKEKIVTTYAENQLEDAILFLNLLNQFTSFTKLSK